MGFAFLVVGFILIISAIFSIAMGFIDVSDEMKEGVPNWMPYCVVGGIGSLICALLYTFFALKVNNGTYSQKIVIGRHRTGRRPVLSYTSNIPHYWLSYLTALIRLTEKPTRSLR